jgi:hypothetical protein
LLGFGPMPPMLVQPVVQPATAQASAASLAVTRMIHKGKGEDMSSAGITYEDLGRMPKPHVAAEVNGRRIREVVFVQADDRPRQAYFYVEGIAPTFATLEQAVDYAKMLRPIGRPNGTRCAITTALLLLALAGPAATETTRFRDEHGREIGRMVQNGDTTRFYDNRGRETGRAKGGSSVAARIWDDTRWRREHTGQR